MYRHLRNGLFAVRFDDQIILLDLLGDAYSVLSLDQSEIVCQILDDTSQAVNYISAADIERFAPLIDSKEFESPDPRVDLRRKLYRGVKLNLWSLEEIHLRKQKSLIGIFSALRTLHIVHRKSATDRMHGLMRLKKEALARCISEPDYDIEKSVVELNNACLLYPRATKCLEWACTLALLNNKRGIESRVVVGVQNRPFYAHAWVEVNGRVVGDDHSLRDQLAVILEF